jgi:hypothetical protein
MLQDIQGDAQGGHHGKLRVLPGNRGKGWNGETVYDEHSERGCEYRHND